MRLSPKILLLVLYLFMFMFLFSQTLSQMPLNEATIPYVVLLVALCVVGIVFILGWDYLIPLIIRSYRLGDCKVEDKKYLLCRYKNSPEITGYIAVKVIPTQPIADMDKERRMSYLDSIQGLLAGAHYEVIVTYIGMKNRYQETIRDRLMRRKQRLVSLAIRESPAIKEELAAIDRELRVLDQVPIILEGFYIAMAREYSTDEDDLKRKLEADGRALVAMLSKLGAKAVVLQGEELRNIISYLLFGSVVQVSF